MSTPVGENDGFVSNDSDSEIRGTSAHGAGLVSDVRNFSYREPRVVKRKYSQLSGRTLNDSNRGPDPGQKFKCLKEMVDNQLISARFINIGAYPQYLYTW